MTIEPSRMLQVFPTAGVPAFIEKARPLQTADNNVEGYEVLESIAGIDSLIHRLVLVRESMLTMLNGETLNERTERIKAEDANPEAPARLGGWTTEGELRETLIGTGKILAFGHWLSESKNGGGQRIVKLSGSVDHIDNKYPKRHQCASDYLSYADDWTDALKRVRTDQATQAAEYRNQVLGY